VKRTESIATHDSGFGFLRFLYGVGRKGNDCVQLEVEFVDAIEARLQNFDR